MSVKVDKDTEKFKEEFERALNTLTKENSSVLTDEGFVSDPFIILKHILLAEPDNIVAKILLKSSAELYRKFGNNSHLYFYFLLNFYESTKKFLAKELTFNLELDSITFPIVIGSDTTDTFLRKHGISDRVIEAFEKADGGDLFLKKGFENKITDVDGFTFKVSPREDFESSESSVYILEGEADIHKIVSLINQSTLPLLVISLSDNKHLAELERLNPTSGFRFVKARPEYLRSDFIIDLKSVVNQSLSSSILVSSATSLGKAKVLCTSNEITLITKDSFVKQQRIKGVESEVVNEKSPLRKMSILQRLTNLVGDRTILYISEQSDSQFLVSLSDYFTQIVEAINMLQYGAVEEADFPNYEKYSSLCVNDAFIRAKADLKLIFSPIQIKQYA